MSTEMIIGIVAIVLGLAAIGAGIYLLGVAVLIEMLDGDE